MSSGIIFCFPPSPGATICCCSGGFYQPLRKAAVPLWCYQLALSFSSLPGAVAASWFLTPPHPQASQLPSHRTPAAPSMVSIPDCCYPGPPSQLPHNESSEAHRVNINSGWNSSHPSASSAPEIRTLWLPCLGGTELLLCSSSPVEPNGITHSCLFNWLNQIKMCLGGWGIMCSLVCILIYTHTHPPNAETQRHGLKIENFQSGLPWWRRG